jgi:[DsrC]-trisulfide reductase subunit M
MSSLTIAYALLLYAATLVLVVGVARKIVIYARTPAPLKIPTTPAPTTAAGVVMRMTREVVFFESLFKASIWTWLFGWVFHFALLVALIGHLRYFVEPVWLWLVPGKTIALYAGLAMLVGLLGLWARRILVDRVRYISAPSDHLMLLLLIGIAASGVAMRTVSRTDIAMVKAFVLGLIYFDWQPLPADGVLLVHLGLVALLMIVFPISKLLHAPGLFFSPTRTQIDNPREHRHTARWAMALESPERTED